MVQFDYKNSNIQKGCFMKKNIDYLFLVATILSGSINWIINVEIKGEIE